jgi:ketosteroid isomerase-like protein
MLAESVEVVIRFITAINSHNIDMISAMISDDHKFTDSLGNVFRGKELMTKGWADYLRLFPDYKIETEEIYENGDKIMFTGKASGSYSGGKNSPEENRWEINAAWRASVVDGKIKEWQVFGDNKPVYEIIERNKK